ncbi:MAG TPA: DUF6600 domain-containing protein [Steroidobacteraceae bacterium]
MNLPLASRLMAAALIGLAGLCAAVPAVAQEPVLDPPGRVARLSYVEGEVSLAPAGTEEWVEAVLNRPLTSGDKLWVAGAGRAELEIASATVHLDSDTNFGFIELDDDVLQMSLTDGAIAVRVRSLRENETVQVETPNGTVRLRHPGEYHVQVEPESDRTIVRARSGEAEVIGASNTYLVRAQEEGVFTGLEELHANIGAIGPRTAFESWANDRDRRHEESTSARYVSREVIGYEDLDEHGEWIHEPSYGYVWRPIHVAHDWAPYRYGRWVWIGPWGWTWVDRARWGFAPFHYGRWAFVRRRWCWVPGPRHGRPIYAPALVGWIGGRSVSVSVSFGNAVGWFPLGPHEAFVPWYAHTPRYIRHVNVSNTFIFDPHHLNHIYAGRARPHRFRHRDFASAVTAVHREQFVAGRPIAGRRLHIDGNSLRQWREDMRPPISRPERESILAGEPRRGPPTRVSLHPRNPKERGDFRDFTRTPGMISRGGRDTPFLHEGRARHLDARGSRPVTLDSANSLRQSRERVEVMRGESGTRDSATLFRDHRVRPPSAQPRRDVAPRVRQWNDSRDLTRSLTPRHSTRRPTGSVTKEPRRQQIEPRSSAPRVHRSNGSSRGATRSSSRSSSRSNHSSPRYQQR